MSAGSLPATVGVLEHGQDVYPPGNMGTFPETSEPLAVLELLLSAWLEHFQTLRSGRGVQEGRCFGTARASHCTPGTTHPPALIPRGSPAPLPLWGLFSPAGSISTPHPHAQHTTLTGAAASPWLGQEEEKAARAAQRKP